MSNEKYYITYESDKVVEFRYNSELRTSETTLICNKDELAKTLRSIEAKEGFRLIRIVRGVELKARLTLDLEEKEDE